MLDFTVRFILATLKFIFKVTLIIGGLIFSSLGNAFIAMLESSEENDKKANDYRMKGFVNDEQSAMREFSRGNISEGQMANFWGVGEKK
ncbi:hypothetical protein [Delftia sp. PS-11]|uniref:hypothetical protein n=1 Tax=Delftia sp. PS-11 TaxID=2767222 RepID=UPI002454A6C3|nr:hypothetical protein [Delftia sp. PS-11]KAJ8744143.1 hypothetical protein H9T68_14085 [Delftia sp. PS-11]